MSALNVAENIAVEREGAQKKIYYYLQLYLSVLYLIGVVK
jgi:hypothetical protein